VLLCLVLTASLLLVAALLDVVGGILIVVEPLAVGSSSGGVARPPTPLDEESSPLRCRRLAAASLRADAAADVS
jgi:hypothetical protein